MRRRLPPRTFCSLTVDIDADHQLYTAAVPADELAGWVWQGTVSIDGVTGALGWRRGGYGVCVGGGVRALGIHEGIEIACAVGRIDPAHERVPEFPKPQTWGGTWGAAAR